MKRTWEQVTKYAIRSGDYTIAKVWLTAGWRYALYRLRVLLGVYATADAAKGAV